MFDRFSSNLTRTFLSFYQEDRFTNHTKSWVPTVVIWVAGGREGVRCRECGETKVASPPGFRSSRVGVIRQQSMLSQSGRSVTQQSTRCHSLLSDGRILTPEPLPLPHCWARQSLHTGLTLRLSSHFHPRHRDSVPTLIALIYNVWGWNLDFSHSRRPDSALPATGRCSWFTRSRSYTARAACEHLK